jgi:hypothetical protein
MNLLSDFAYNQSLTRDRAAYSLVSSAVDAVVDQVLNNHSLAPTLMRFAASLEEDVSDYRSRPKYSFISFAGAKQGLIDPIIDRFLNLFYSSVTVKSAPNITLLAADLGGFGDYIFQVRSLKALKPAMPRAKFHVITKDRQKLEKLLVNTPVTCAISEYRVSNMEAVFDVEALGALEKAALALISPAGVFHSPEITRLKNKKRCMTIIEYDRPEYGLDIDQSYYVSGLGPNALGIFKDQDLKRFADEHPHALSPIEKQELLLKLGDRKIYNLLQVLDSTFSHRLYFGYGHADQARALEVVIREEARLDTRDALIFSPSFNETELLQKLDSKLPDGIQKLVVHSFSTSELDVVKDFVLQNVRIDLEKVSQLIKNLCMQYEKAENRWIKNFLKEQIGFLSKAIETQKSSSSLKLPEAFQQSLENGLFFLEGGQVKSRVLAESAKSGKTLHIIEFAGLSLSDTLLLKKCAEKLRFSTGDQSLSDDVSLRSLIMYDSRKTQPGRALQAVAQKRKLNLMAKYIAAFMDNKTDEVLRCLSKRSQLRAEADQLYTHIHNEKDLGVQLIALVKRRLYHLASGFQLQPHEKRIHNLFLTYILSPRRHELAAVILELDAMSKLRQSCI